MIVRPIYAEDVDMAMSLANNQYRPPELLDTIMASNRNFVDSVKNYSQSLADKAASMFNYFNNNPLVDKIKNRLSRSEVVLSDSAIHMVTPVNIYNPSLTMRRYIMAQPRAFNLYRKDRINAYDEMWEITERNVKPEWRDDYLKVIDGVMRFDKEDGYGYTEHALGIKNELTFMEQNIIQEAWDVFDNLMDRDIDPTDIENYGRKEMDNGQ